MRLLIPCITLLCLFVWARPSNGQSVDNIIAKNIEARGGLKLIKSVQSVEMSGNVDYQGLSAPFKYIIKRPHKMRLEMMVNSDTLIQCYNGKIAWASIPKNGQNIVQKLPATESQALRKQADFDGPLINYKKKGYKVSYAGKTTIGKETAYTLNLTDPQKHNIIMYIDTHNFHDIREATTKAINRGNSQMKNVFKIETDYSNFKSYKGLTLPYKITTKINGRLITQMNVTKVTLNGNYPNNLFQFPFNLNTN